MKISFVKVTVCIMIAMVLFACGKSSDSSSGAAMGYYTAGEIGTYASPWSDGSSSYHPAMAVKFTPSSYPVTIKSVTLYAINNTGTDQLFNVYGFSDLSSETEIFTSVPDQSIPDTGSSAYYEKTVDIPDTTITSGSFYIAVEWVTKPLSAVSGANAFFLCTDSGIDNVNTNFILFTTSWETYESVSATGGDIGILVNY